MSQELVCIDNIHSVLSEIESAFFPIPFENSEFQTMVFVLAAQQTPARAYRALGLRMFSKLQAVKEHLYNTAMTNILIEEKTDMLSDCNVSKYDKRRAELEIEKIRAGASFADKLLNDALTELNILWREFQKFPRYTREQFEAEEAQHFDARLKRQMQFGGAAESLENMNTDARNIEQAIAQAKVLLTPPPGKHFPLGTYP
jgi:hypothetical protein